VLSFKQPRGAPYIRKSLVKELSFFSEMQLLKLLNSRTVKCLHWSTLKRCPVHCSSC